MKFYYSTATSSTISHLLLREAGLPFTGIEVSWNRKVNVEELNKANPLGTVPALITDDEKLLTQNAAIIEYVADLKPEAALLPKAGTFERADAMSWVAFACSDFTRAMSLVLGGARLTTNEGAQKELREAGLTKMKTYLEHVDKSLAGKDFLLGKQFSAADIAMFTFLCWTKWAEVQLTPYQNLSTYLKRVSGRPAVKAVFEAEGLADLLH